MYCNDLHYGHQLFIRITIQIYDKIYDKMYGIKNISQAN